MSALSCAPRPSAVARTMGPDQEVTRLLDAAQHGDPVAAERLLRRVYDELHGMAAGLLAREAGDCSVQATMLVHDAWLRLCGNEVGRFERRAHFFGAAARAMRRLLVERARRAQAQQRGGARCKVALDDLDAGAVLVAASNGGPEDREGEAVLALHLALEEFERVSPKAARVVELRYFAGLTIPETAAAVGRSEATVNREWTYARAWLHDRILSHRDGPEGAER